ncbi:hypothetical protein [Raoultibacter phocaeensis]|uniref:hypothetical protein n=1 Tax=Raoultibacter phocaeensis TaxID=2479841 RepID=UPI00111956FE|nr:hypothetical protein [Raoultibacter phocaeensis]
MLSIASIFLNEGIIKGLACLFIFCITKIVYKFEYPDYSLKELIGEAFSQCAIMYQALTAGHPSCIWRKISSVALIIVVTPVAFIFWFVCEPNRVFPVFLIPITPVIVEQLYQQNFATLLGA